MKRISVIGMAIVCGLMFCALPANAQTRKDKKKAEREKWLAEQDYQRTKDSLQRAIELSKLEQQASLAQGKIPCIQASYDDAEYFREVGVGSDEDNGLAREKASDNAKVLIRKKMAEFVKGFATDYSKSIRDTGAGSSIQGEVERLCNIAIEGALDNAEKICEKTYPDDRGSWVSYYTVQIKKVTIKEAMAKSLEGTVGNNKEQFQKVFDERADKLIEESRNYNNR